MDRVGTVIIGAGVVGLALARQLARAGPAPVVIEAEDQFGAHLSSRNSEVVHAGLYYPPTSLKARTCLRGNHLLGEYCAQRGISLARCGKLVVARAGQEPVLAALHDNARAAGASGLTRVSAAWLATREPWLEAREALLSETSGIVDSHALMASLAREAQDQGAVFAFRHRVRHIECRAGDFRLTLDTPAGEATLGSERLINAAGLGAVPLVARMAGFPDHARPTQRYAKGHYFALHGPAPSRRLIYPLPEAHGLGIHLTLDLTGRARFGPDVEWVNAPDYRVDETRHGAFVEAIHRYWPALEPRRLRPNSASVRPKLYLGGEPCPDFFIQDASHHGLDGLTNLLGVESPGLTAALALAEQLE